MTKAQHTPGPWKWSRADFKAVWADGVTEMPDGPFEALVTADGKIVGIAQDASSYSASFDASPADKSLIAAAPELLKVLKAVVAYYKKMGGPAQQWAAAKTAIAKAEGGIVAEYEALEIKKMKGDNL